MLSIDNVQQSCIIMSFGIARRKKVGHASGK